MEIGRLCIKIAGRDAGLTCVIVDMLDEKFAMIDGQTRRRKCNVMHLEPLKDVLKIKKGAAHEEVVAEFKKLGLAIKEKKIKQRTERPKKVRKAAEKPKENKKKAEKKQHAKEEKEEKKSKPKLKAVKKE